MSEVLGEGGGWVACIDFNFLLKPVKHLKAEIHKGEQERK
jgi:hypothetical protein